MLNSKYSLDHIAHAGSGSVYTGPNYVLIPKLLQQFLSAKGKKVLQDFVVRGVLSTTIHELFEFFVENGGKLVINKCNGDYGFLFKEAVIYVDYAITTKDVTITCNTLDPSLLEMEDLLKKNFVTQTKKNLVYTIVKTTSSLAIRNIGNGSSPLIEENYAPAVLKDAEYVIESFNKVPPRGRICILNGEPGTGKTHLIRSMLSQLDCVFVIVPSNLVDALDKPEFMPLLLDIKTEHMRPIILVIEDGDTCLVPRKNDNISTITSLLNLSDGILGAIVDIKMIISTNAGINDMDGAIMRPGRLCRKIHVGALPFEQANKVYQRLTKDPKASLPPRKEYTLAQIYSTVNNTDPTSKTPTTTDESSIYGSGKRVIGFQRSNNLDVTLNKK